MVERITQATAELVVGDPSDEASDIGAIVSSEQLERVRSYIELG